MKIWGLFAASLPSIDLAEKLFDIRKDDIELGGSTGAERVSWGSRKWIRKIQNSNQLKEELIADLIYHHLNVPVPPSKIYNINGTFMKLSVYLEGSTEVAHHLLKATNKTQTLIHLQKDYQQNFIVDAYLANWDVLGGLGDNIRVYHEKIYRVDTGGSLRFRAQGNLKGSWFGPKVIELETMTCKTSITPPQCLKWIPARILRKEKIIYIPSIFYKWTQFTIYQMKEMIGKFLEKEEILRNLLYSMNIEDELRIILLQRLDYLKEYYMLMFDS